MSNPAPIVKVRPRVDPTELQYYWSPVLSWVAVGSNSDSTVNIAKSTDGMTWTDSSNNPFSGGQGFGIAWNGSYWVAVGGNTANTVCIAKSTDGMTWTNATDNPFSGAYGFGIAWNGSYWVAVGNNTGSTVCIAKSTDGMTWTNSTNNPFSGESARGIAWNGSYWVAVGGNGATTVSIAKSTDGMTWTNADNPFSGGYGFGISWNANYWVAIGNNTANTVCIAKSTDGMTWTESSSNPFTGGTGLGIATIPITGFVLESVSPSISVSLGPTELTKTITGLTTLTDYSFTIKTDISGSYSAQAPFRTVRTSAKPQPVSTLTKSQSVSGELSVTFTWTNPGDYAYYYLLGLRAATGTKDSIYSGTSDYATLSHTFTGLDPTRAYTFNIQRGNDAGYSVATSITTTAAIVFDPTTVSGLHLWLDAADVSGNGSIVADGTVVGTWYDKSGEANKGTATAGATLQTDSLGRYLDFTGTSWYDLSSNNWAYNQYYTIFIVDKPIDYAANYTLVGRQAVSTDLFYIQYATDGIRLSSQGDNTALGDTFESLTAPVNVWCFTNYGGKTAYWNRLISGKNPVAAAYITDSLLSIGAKQAGSEPYNGKMREVLLYTGIMTETNRETITTYLYNKWYTQPTLIPLMPAENGTVLWLDGYDIKTFFEDASGTIPITNNFDSVYLWKDKSGFENDMGVSGGQYRSDVNDFGLPGLFLNVVIAQTANYLQTGDASLFLVGWADSVGDYFFKHDSSGNFGLNYNGTGLSWGESSTTNNNQFPYTSGKYLFYGTMRKGQLIAGTFINDNKIYTSYAVDTLVLPVAEAPITLSQSNNIAYFEVIYYNRVLTESEIQQNAAYLSNKWAIPIPSSVFTPATAPGLQVWLDSSDPCTVFKSGEVVIAWKDKSGNNNHATPYGAPIVNNGIIFDGSGQYFSLPDGALPRGTYSYYTVTDVSANSVIIHGGSRDISGEIFVAVGPGGTAVSYDLLLWTDINTPLNDTRGIAWNGSYWVAVGYLNSGVSIAKSIDGIIWTAALDNLIDIVYGIAWNGSYWVAVGYDANQIVSIAKSTNADTWTASDNPFSAGGEGRGIAWNGSYWLAVGNNSDSTVTIAKSTDGDTWTNSGNPFSGGIGYGIAWNGSYWIAVGYNSGSTITIAKSTDGDTWTASTNPFSGGEGAGIAWNGSYWIAVGENGTQTVTIAKSTDGDTWVPATNNLFYECYTASWFDSYWVVLGSPLTTGTMATSTDGLIWTPASDPFPDNVGYGIAAGISPVHNSLMNINTQKLPLFIAGGFGTYSIARSYDGITYIPSYSANSISGGQSAFAVGYGDGTWLMAGEEFMGNSKDGITWYSVNDPFGGNCFTIVYMNDIWVAGGQGVNSLVYSLNGTDWTASTSGNNIFYACYAVTYVEGMWVAAGDTGAVVTLAKSINGTEWTEFSNLGDIITSNCSTIAYGNGLWLAGGYGTNQMAYSSNAITWYADTSGNSIFSSSCSSIKYANSLWVACGTGNYNLAYSTDGLNWTGVVIDDISYLNTVNYTNGVWVAGGFTYSYNGVYSTDGINWYPSANAGDIFTVSMNSIGVTDVPTQAAETLFDNNVVSPVWLAGGLATGGSNVIFSRDGINWDISTASNIFTQDASGQCHAIAYANNMWVIGGRGINKIAYSYNGIDWTNSVTATQVIGGIVYKIAYGDGRWVAVGDSNNFIVYSFNGADWMQSNNIYSLGTDVCRTVAYADGIWVAGGDLNSTVIYSIDAIHWLTSTSGTSIFTQGMLTVANGNGRWIAGGNDSSGNTMAYSTDGINWISDISGSTLLTTLCSAVEYGNNLWVAGGKDGASLVIIYSSDGINWTTSASGSAIFSNNINSIAYTNGIWRAGGNGTNQVAYSNNGTTWYPDISANNIILTSGAAFGFGSTSRNISNLTDTNPFSRSDTVIVESIYNNSSKELFLSGIIGATDSSTHIQDASNNYIGWDMSGNYMNGTIKEILIYNEAHGIEQRQSVEKYLRDKWYSANYLPTGASLWLDAAPANFTLSGSAIQTWKDISVEANNFTQSAAWGQPIYSLDAVTGKYGVQFAANGIANGLTSATSPFGVTNSWSIFTVQRYDFSTHESIELVNNNICTAYEISDDDPTAFSIGTQDVAEPSITELQFTAAANIDTPTVEIHKIPVLTSQVVNSLVYYNFINGASVASYTLTQAMTADAKLQIGFTGTLTPTLAGAMRGYIYEIIVFNTSISREDQYKIEGYLAWKWGIQNSLPTTHPYYLQAP